MTSRRSTSKLTVALAAAVLLGCLAPSQVLAGVGPLPRKAPVLKRMVTSVKVKWQRFKLNRATNKAFRKLVRSDKQFKAVYKAEKKARGTGTIRTVKWSNLTMGAINGGFAVALLAAGNPFGIVNTGVSIWSAGSAGEAHQGLKSQLLGARRYTVKAAMDRGVKVDPVLIKGLSLGRALGQRYSSNSARDAARVRDARDASALRRLGSSLR